MVGIPGNSSAELSSSELTLACVKAVGKLTKSRFVRLILPVHSHHLRKLRSGIPGRKLNLEGLRNAVCWLAPCVAHGLMIIHEISHTAERTCPWNAAAYSGPGPHAPVNNAIA